MAIATPTTPSSEASRPPAPPPRRLLPTLDVITVAAVAVFAVLLVLLTSSDQFGPLPTLALGALSGVVLFSACGAALAFALVLASWGPLVPLLSLPLGAAASGLVLSAPPTATDVALPVDTVPRFWRFRYSIFYPLAAASNLVHMDPIRLFPSMSALLIVIAALGFGAFAVQCLRAPARAGPVVAAAVGLSAITLHLAWHPYWNQLWGLAMMPYALLFGWSALETLDIRLGALCAIVVVMLALAYPLALPDPLVILVALAIGYGRRPRLAALRCRKG